MMPAGAVDPDLRALLSHDRAHITPPDSSVAISAFRDFLDAPLSALDGGPVEQVRDIMVASPTGHVTARLYRPSAGDGPSPVILFCHGGGFVAGSIDTHDALCRTLCRQSDIPVLSIGYRLAPEHPYPAAVQDCVSVLMWLAAHGREHGLDAARVGLCGDSAGGYLAILAGLMARRRGLAVGLLFVGLLYPVVDPACNSPSMKALAEGYLLTRDAMRWFWDAFSGRGTDAETAAPSLLEEDLSVLPPILILTAQFDPLRDEGAALARRLAEAGVDVSLQCYSGMIHGFASLSHLTPVAAQALRQLGDAMAARLDNARPCAD